MKKNLLSCLAVGAVLSLGLTAAAPAFADGHQEKKILMVLWRGMTVWEKPFMAKLEELGVKAKFTQVSGEQDKKTLAKALRDQEPKIAAKEYDAVYSFGTTATKMTQNMVKDRTPIVFNIVFDPLGAGIVKSMEAPGVQATGATNGVPVADQLDAFMKLAPFKKLGVLFNAREANSNIILKKAEAWSAKTGIAIETLRVAPSGNLLEKALESIKSGETQVDAVYAGADSFLGSKSADIQKAVGDKVKLFGGTMLFTKNGWLAAYTPTAEGMGGAAAGLMAKVLAGEDPSKLPVILPTPTLLVSKKAAAAHNVTIPADAVAND